MTDLVGMAAGAAEHGFDRFQRGANVGGIQGTGIGLVVAQTIVELHGGRIDVASEEGARSAFTVYLPLEHAPDETNESPPA